MPIYGYLMDRNKIISKEEDLPCGVYRRYIDALDCEECNGTGNEEVSGGHKKECSHCFGQGLDPIKMRRFEYAPVGLDDLPMRGKKEDHRGHSYPDKWDEFKTYWTDYLIDHHDKKAGDQKECHDRWCRARWEG